MPKPVIEYACETCQHVFPDSFFDERHESSWKGSNALVQALLHLHEIHGMRGVFSKDAEQRPRNYKAIKETNGDRMTDTRGNQYNATTYTQETPTGLVTVTVRHYIG